MFSHSEGAALDAGMTAIAYCFTSIKGYSKFGSYTGNGNTDGTFVYTGFRPAFFTKKSNSTIIGTCMTSDVNGTVNTLVIRFLPDDSQAENG